MSADPKAQEYWLCALLGHKKPKEAGDDDDVWFCSRRGCRQMIRVVQRYGPNDI